MYVTFKHPNTGKLKSVKVGFSWPLLFTAPLLGAGLFFRGMWLDGISLIAGLIITPMIMPSFFYQHWPELLISWSTIIAWQGNKNYAANLAKKGWVMLGDEAQLAYARAKWGITA